MSSDEVAPCVLFFTAMPSSAADFTFLHGQWCRGSNIRRFNKRSRDECESHCRKADCVCFQYKDTPTQEEGNCRFTRADEYTPPARRRRRRRLRADRHRRQAHAAL